MARGSKASSMAEEKVVTDGEASVSSSYPSMNVLRGLGNHPVKAEERRG